MESKRDLHSFLPSDSHGFSSLRTSSPLSHAAHLSILEWARRKWASLAVASTAGEARYLLTWSHVPLGEIAGIAGLLALSYAGLGEGCPGKVTVFLLPSSMCPVSSLFSNSVLELLVILLDMHKGTFESDCQIHHSLGVKTVGKSCFLHFLSSLPNFMFGNTNCHKYLSLLEENNFNFSVIDNYEFCVVLFNTD